LEGLISAACLVAFATNLLIETADDVFSGTHSYEQLIFASDKVGGRRARAARRGVACDVSSMSRANLIMSKTQERLFEVAAKAVTDSEAACKALMKLVRTISATQVVIREGRRGLQKHGGA
jgi:hypothetical protein